MAHDLGAKLAILGQRLGIAMMVVVTLISIATGVEVTSALIRGGLGLTAFSALGWVCALALTAVAPPARENPSEEPQAHRVDVSLEAESPTEPSS